MSSGSNITRRGFVKLCGAFGLLMASPVSLVPLAEASTKERFTETRLKMGTIVTITAVGGSESKTREGFESAWREMDRLIAIFDRHQEGTAVSVLNKKGYLAAPSSEMLDVLGQSAHIHFLSEGSFDPTVLPLLQMIEESFEQTGNPPDRSALAEAAHLVDFKGVRFDKTGVNLGAMGRRISLDGVAKGYIVDKVGERLRQSGIENVLLNAGGDILALGRREGGKPWLVGIQDPFDSGKNIKVLGLSDQAVATSGSYEIFFDKRKVYHHLMNPATGESAHGQVSATVVTTTTAQADALATAAFVRPEVLARVGGTEGLIVDAHGVPQATAGFKNMIV